MTKALTPRPSWIPEEVPPTVGARFMSYGDPDNPCAYEVVEFPSAPCRDCGVVALVVVECIASAKSAIREVMPDEEIDGDMTGDHICTCQFCGAVESGSYPFDLIRQEA